MVKKIIETIVDIEHCEDCPHCGSWEGMCMMLDKPVYSGEIREDCPLKDWEAK